MIIALVFFCTCLLALNFLKLVPKGYKIPLVVNFFYHMAIGGYYWHYSLRNPADSQRYFQDAKSGHVNYELGTDFISYTASWFVIPVNANYYSTMLLYSFFGMFGLWFVYAAVLENLVKYPGRRTRLLAYSILFIPGLNFWTSALGKDSLIMLGIGALIFSTSRFDRRKLLLLFSLILIFHIRPHVAMAIVTALGLAIILDRKTYSVHKMGMLLLLGVAFIFAAPTVTEYVGLEEVDEQSVDEYIEHRQASNLMGGSSVEISQYNLLGQILTYLYRPFFIDANNALGLVVSMENFYYIIISILLFKWMKRISNKNIAGISILYIKFSFLYGFFMTLMLSTTTANLGIAIRQKTMFIVCLIALTAIYSSYHDALNRNNIRH